MSISSGKARTGPDNGRWEGGKSTHELTEIYWDMVRRCLHPKHARYADYGGRGISVHPEWAEDFWAFVRDVGERPEGKTQGGRAYWQLDRIDNDGNYEPGNVRWATPSQQAANRRESAWSGVLRGSRQKLSKLSEKQVLAIVSENDKGVSQHSLAGKYGVSVSTVHNIIRGRSWAWLTGRGQGVENRHL